MPNDDFYRIDTALLVPSLDTATWQLRIHGLVERETTLTWDQLISLPMFEQYCTIACVSNEVGGHLVGNAKWTGVRLRDVLDIAGPTSQATQLVGRSVDGWTAGMPMAWVIDPAREPMIAVEMNDEPLPRAHGYPARLIVPGLYGYVSATKWLWELELTTLGVVRRLLGAARLVEGGPDPDAVAHRHAARVDRAAGRVPIAGVAWAPDRGISKVEVGIDGAVARRRSCRPRSRTRRGSSGSTRGTRRRASTRISVRATDGTGRAPGGDPVATGTRRRARLAHASASWSASTGRSDRTRNSV